MHLLALTNLNYVLTCCSYKDVLGIKKRPERAIRDIQRIISYFSQNSVHTEYIVCTVKSVENKAVGCFTPIIDPIIKITKSGRVNNALFLISVYICYYLKIKLNEGKENKFSYFTEK